jgi:polypeptide N-acetylgalactosaminyltransferase
VAGEEGWQKNAFNQYVSDLISLHRSLPDLRLVLYLAP